jgi:uroporphyrinogen decarboxylase
VAEMTSHERFKRTYQHRQADRVPIVDSLWGATIERWRREGMPADVDWVDYFGLDHVGRIAVDNSPRFEVKTLSQTQEYKVWTTRWGATLKEWTHAGGTPEFLEFKITDPDSWAAAKKRMRPTPDRIDLDRLRADYKRWRQKGYWVEAELWFGFDVTHSWTVGTERLLIALIEQPEWCVDMFNTFLDVNLALLEMVWQAGCEFDSVRWPDDLGYKHSQFMSLEMYRRLLKPVQRRACQWAHARGVQTHLHSCGDVNPFVPEFIEIGIDALEPLEVKAGMDPIRLKAQHARELVLHGGINAVLWDEPEAVEAEIRKILPVVKDGGGYVFSSDHSVPSSVSLEDFRRIVELAKRLGSY